MDFNYCTDFDVELERTKREVAEYISNRIPYLEVIEVDRQALYVESIHHAGSCLIKRGIYKDHHAMIMNHCKNTIDELILNRGLGMVRYIREQLVIQVAGLKSRVHNHNVKHKMAGECVYAMYIKSLRRSIVTSLYKDVRLAYGIPESYKSPIVSDYIKVLVDQLEFPKPLARYTDEQVAMS